MAPLLALDDVFKNYGSIVVTDGLSFSLEEGEALGVIGPNGAGKSTLFNLISGTVRPSRGSIRFQGTDITGMPPHRRCRLGIGRSFQIPQPFASLTVLENLLVAATFGRVANGADETGRCVDVLTRTGLLAKANTRAGVLTLLERKRLEMARALATGPRLLLLDEVAGGLTEGECAELVQTIRGVHASGTTIIWIEHIVHALMAVAGRLLVLNFGQKVADGEPHAVMQSPRVQEIYMGIGTE